MVNDSIHYDRIYIIILQPLLQRLWLGKNKYFNFLSSDARENVKKPKKA